MSIEPFKYLIQAVAIERDDAGRIVAERIAEVVTVFNAEQAAEAVREFERAVTQITTEGEQHEPDQQDNGRAEGDPAGRPPAGGVRRS
jgi:hypothetical protein